jgi:hypothetical protein
MEQTLGIDYPDTVIYTLKFADGLARQHKSDKAIELLNGAAEAARQKLGSDHPVPAKYASVLRQLVTAQR